jgi:hypothetical protein
MRRTGIAPVPRGSGVAWSEAKETALSWTPGRAVESDSERAARTRTPPWKGSFTRARTEPVSWLEAEPPAFPDLAIQWHSGRSTPDAARPGLSQWRGRAGLAPDFRKAPFVLLDCLLKSSGAPVAPATPAQLSV